MTYAKVASNSIHLMVGSSVVALGLIFGATMVDRPWDVVLTVVALVAVGGIAASLGLWSANEEARKQAAAEAARERGDDDHDR